MAVEVAEVLPNGFLAIKGCQESLHAGEVCERSLTGKVSPQSVTPDRRVHQQDIAELRIAVRKFKWDGDGAVQPASAQEVQKDEATSLTATKTAFLREKEAQLASLEQEVNQLRGEVRLTQQILIKIQMLEVSLTKLRRMGFEFSVPGYTFSADSPSDLQKIISGSPVAFSKTPAIATLGMVDWLCQNRIAKVLTRPNIVCVNGQPAEFCVGGEVPIPGRGGLPAVDFQKVGTDVSLLAIALGEDHVRLNIRTRISELDESHKLQIGESVVPAFKVRRSLTRRSKASLANRPCSVVELKTAPNRFGKLAKTARRNSSTKTMKSRWL